MYDYNESFEWENDDDHHKFQLLTLMKKTIWFFLLQNIR